MFTSKEIERMGKGFHPSRTKLRGNRKKRRESLQSSGYKDGAMIVFGGSRFKYRRQIIEWFDYVAGVIKRKNIYHLDQLS